jgi:hypothetical protein
MDPKVSLILRRVPCESHFRIPLSYIQTSEISMGVRHRTAPARVFGKRLRRNADTRHVVSRGLDRVAYPAEEHNGLLNLRWIRLRIDRDEAGYRADFRLGPIGRVQPRQSD